MSLTAPGASSGRRYDLDWLRVIAFAILIFYHIGMFYVTWDWHVKSPHASSDAQPLMMLVNPWRLALLFLISGIALRYATDKGRLWRFSGVRSIRLILPILFGMAVVVAPQSYFEMRQGGVIEPGFGAFYGEYLNFYPRMVSDWGLIVPTWNHLWYVVYLLVYTWIILMLIHPLRFLARKLESLPARAWPLVLTLPALPFLVWRFALEPHFLTTHNLVWDWANHANALTMVLIGFLLARNDGFWRAVGKALPFSLAGVVLAGMMLLWSWQPVIWVTYFNEGPGAAAYETVRVFYAWWVILTILGLGQRYLNRNSALLRYATAMIFCWYILHQTITVSAGYYLAQMDLSAITEFTLLTLATLAGCLAGGEAIRRVPLMREFFGISRKARSPSGKARDDGHRRTADAAPVSSSASSAAAS